MYSFGYKLVDHDMRRTNGIIGINNQLVIVQIFTRYSTHLFVKAGQTLRQFYSNDSKIRTESYPSGGFVKWGALCDTM